MAGTLATGRVAQRARYAADTLWRFLRRPSLAIVLALLLLTLLLIGRLVPQIPGQAAEDPASAVRWLSAERDAWGAWGGALRTLGLFNVAGSPFFFALIALLALVCGVHLATLIDAVRLPDRLTEALAAPEGVNPLPLARQDGVQQLRIALPQPPHEAIVALKETIVSKVGPTQGPAYPTGIDREVGDEIRLLATVGMRGLQLRPLLPAGALLALGVLWFTAVFGWNVVPPTLAPGETFTAPTHGVAITYTVPALSASAIHVGIGEESATLAAGAGQARVNGATVRVQPDAPAVLLRAETPLLALPGAPESRTDVGLVFPQPGSEQIVLLPASGVGVRIVRLAAEPAGAFLVEVYARDGVQPVQRVEVKEAQSLMLPLETGDLPLWVEPTPGIRVTVRSTPGGWLLWPALALMLAGLAGLRHTPRFVLAQLQPWPVGRTVLTLQSNEAALIETIVAPPDASDALTV